jgi:hypothetical protein
MEIIKQLQAPMLFFMLCMSMFILAASFGELRKIRQIMEQNVDC